MPNAEKILMTADGACRGADFVEISPRATINKNTLGKPVITLRSDGEVLFSCNQETSSGSCLLSTRERPCAVRPIFIRKVSSENVEIGRRAIAVKGGTLDYDPTERTIFDWPGKPAETEPQTLSETENKLLQTLTANPYTIFSYNALCSVLWPEETPSTASSQLKNHIHDLREKIGHKIIETVRQRGYRIRIPDNPTDVA